MSKDAAWEIVFRELDVLNAVGRDGYADILASDIKRVVQAAGVRPDEPRILCKMDYRASRPEILKANGLSLLAIRNGVYRLARTDPYLDLPTYDARDSEVIEWTPLATLDPSDVTSESKALQVAYVSGILERVFGESVTMTIFGRERAEAFQFTLDGVDYDVEDVQIEIDGGYEGTAVHLVEAKNQQQYFDMSYRQIVYPLHQYESKLQGEKQVFVYGMTYEAPFFRFVRYDAARGVFDASSQRVFHIRGTLPELDLHSIKATPSLIDPTVSLPGANDFSRVLKLLELLAAAGAGGIQAPQEFLSDYFGFGSRESDDYADVLKWMRLASVDEPGGILKPTSRAQIIGGLPVAERLKEMAEIVFSCPVFSRALREGASSVDVDLVTRAGYRMSATTVARRKSTVDKWLEYFRARFPS